jgi:hypothetical protein
MQASKTTFGGSTIMIASNVYISTVIDLDHSSTTVMMLLMTTMIASITPVGSMIWMDSFVMIKSEVRVVSLFYIQVPIYETTLSRIWWVISAYTTTPSPTVSNAQLIGTITGIVILLFGFAALIHGLVRKRKAEEVSCHLDTNDFSLSVVRQSLEQQNQEEDQGAEGPVGPDLVQPPGIDIELGREEVFGFGSDEGWAE